LVAADKLRFHRTPSMARTDCLRRDCWRVRALVPVWHENEIVERFLLSARDDAAAKSGGAMPSAAQPETRTAERLHVRPLL